jgi:hypothetical protein
MESKRLIPYSVHLREDIYLKVKEAAKDRKATALVRDAITMMIEGNDEFNAGYNKAIRDVIGVIHEDNFCNLIGLKEVTLAEYIEELLVPMIVHQKPNRRKK